MMKQDNQPTAAEVAKSLTTEEVAALKRVSHGRNLNAITYTELFEKGLVVVKYTTGLSNQDVLTPLGTEVLSALEPSAPADGQSLTTKYAIGKSTRHKDGDEVHAPPVSTDTDFLDESFRLRSIVFDTYDKAKEAADKAGTINPVGFVVLRISDSAAHQSATAAEGDFVPNKKFSDMTSDELAKWHADEYLMWNGETVEETFAKDTPQPSHEATEATSPSDDLDSVDLAVASISAEFIGKKDHMEAVWSNLNTIDESWHEARTELATLRSQLTVQAAERAKMVAHIDDMHAAHEEQQTEIADLKAQAKDDVRTQTKYFDEIWAHVTAGKIGNWDYPAQVVRHVGHMAEDFASQQARIEAAGKLAAAGDTE